MITFCPDTPETRAEFNRLKDRILHPHNHRVRRTHGQELNDGTQQRRENP